jgi:hypothetical protein
VPLKVRPSFLLALMLITFFFFLPLHVSVGSGGSSEAVVWTVGQDRPLYKGGVSPASIQWELTGIYAGSGGSSEAAVGASDGD